VAGKPAEFPQVASFQDEKRGYYGMKIDHQALQRSKYFEFVSDRSTASE
jgi:hypothetical protein